MDLRGGVRARDAGRRRANLDPSASVILTHLWLGRSRCVVVEHRSERLPALAVYRDLTRLPPLLIHAVGHEVCHDDSVRLAATGRAAGVKVTITEYPDVEHIRILHGRWRIRYRERYPEDGVEWIDSGAEGPEAVTAVDKMGAFVRAHAS
jgi:acetyl esterase/lipase